MKMKCEYCSNKAVAIIFDESDYQFKYICEKCLEEFIRTFGEINLEYHYMLNLPLLVEWLKTTANEEIRYREEKLKNLRKKLAEKKM